MRRSVTVFLLVVSCTWLLSCGSAYYNTFFNANQAFKTAEGTRKDSLSKRIDKANYEKAIEKSLKIIEHYSSSKWYDDALFVLGVSYFYTDQPHKADRRMRELLANYEGSEYTKEATVYLAKIKLELGDEENAMALFEEIFASDYSKDNKKEAAFSLGNYYFEKDQLALGINYFMAVRDSLGEKEEKVEAQLKIADGQFKAFQFGEALGSYLQLLGMDPTTAVRYNCLHQAAISAFRLQRISTGMDYLNQLMEEELYYDSLDVLKLDMAEGYEMDGDNELAYDLYYDVASSDENSQRTAYANYRMGLIHQFDFDDLLEAKKYYDLTIKSDRRSETGKDALQRSTDIGKLEKFTERFTRDSTVTQTEIDEAGYNQFLLAELYWFSLDKPDSAIIEMHYLVDSFPDAYDTPNGMIALSQMYKEHYQDSVKADSILHVMLTRYPTSDYLPEALEVLGLLGSSADTGYAELFLHKAENFLIDDDNVDSAKANYQIIVDQFPDSRYYTKAVFNLIILMELYENPGDSSVFYAYQEFVDSFPGNEYATAATTKIRSITRTASRANRYNQEQDEKIDDEDKIVGNKEADTSMSKRGNYFTAEQSLYQRPNGDTIILLDLTPVDVLEEFEFPESALSLKDNFVQIYYHVLLDFSGTVIETELKTPSGHDEIDARVERSIMTMTFNPADVSTLISAMDLPEDEDNRGHWFVYKYLVRKPEFLR